MGIKSRLKELIHWHKFTTLLIYPPHNKRCNKPQCAESDTYGFCYTVIVDIPKPTKLPYNIKEYLKSARNLTTPSSRLPRQMRMR